MFFSKKQNFGFTIIDLLVSMAIMTLLTLTSVISFMQAERNQNLNNAAEVFASQLRELENLSLAGKAIEIFGEPEPLVPAGGYGIYFSRSGTDINYLFFADMNRDLVYDPSKVYDYLPTADQEIQLKTKYSPHQDIFISEVRLDDVPRDLATGGPLNIIFKTPTAKVYVNGGTNVSWVSVVLKHQKTEKTKTIKIYPLSRQISVE